MKVQPRLDQTRRWLRGPFTDDAGTEGRQRVASFPDDVDDINRHAAGQCDGKELNRRRPGGAIAVDDDGHSSAVGIEAPGLGPLEFGGDRRFRHAGATLVLIQGRTTAGDSASAMNSIGALAPSVESIQISERRSGALIEWPTA